MYRPARSASKRMPPKLLGQLRSKGVNNAFVREDQVEGKTLYRVRVGPIPSVNEFDKVVKRLRILGFPDTHASPPTNSLISSCSRSRGTRLPIRLLSRGAMGRIRPRLVIPRELHHACKQARLPAEIRRTAGCSRWRWSRVQMLSNRLPDARIAAPLPDVAATPRPPASSRRRSRRRRRCRPRLYPAGLRQRPDARRHQRRTSA